MTIGLGRELGSARIFHLAQNPSYDGQLTTFSEGDGNFTADLLGELGQRCPFIEDKLKPWQELWRTRDEEEPNYYGLMLTQDIMVGTDKIIKTLARCTGNCAECIFLIDESLTVDAANKINIKG